MAINTVVNNLIFLNWRSLLDLGVFTKSNVDERLQMFARRHSYRLSSTLEPRVRISSALMLHFFLSAVYHEKVGSERRRLFSSRSRFSQYAEP